MVDPKTAIERELVDEALERLDISSGFGRVFNKDSGGGFSRLFSRGGPPIKELTAQEITNMDDATFKKFAERLRLLQENSIAEPSDYSKGR